MLAHLREALRQRRLTAKTIAAEFGVAEPTIRRWLHGRGLTLERLDQLCTLAGIDLCDLAATLPGSGATEFTLAQERVLAADRALAFLFFAILNGAGVDDVGRDLELAPARVASRLHLLVRAGLIRLAANGRPHPLTTRCVAWQPDGPLAAAFDHTIKPLFLAKPDRGDDAHYVADMVRLSEAARAQVYALFAALRLDIHRIAEADRAARMPKYDWSGVYMLVRNLDMTAVGRDIDRAATSPLRPR